MTSPQKSLHVVGAGLIGGSVALGAARAGWSVTVVDADHDAALLIRSRIAAMTPDLALPAGGEQLGGDPDVVLIAVPPHELAPVAEQALRRYVDATVTDVGSVKAQPLADIETLGGDLDRYVPGHPIAGSETSGATAARPGLFEGRTWVLCPTPTNGLAMKPVRSLVTDLGATAVLVPAGAHDVALAVTSHLPQVLASALASVVADAFADDSPLVRADAVSAAELSGPALLDMTRIAASSADLWETIAAANASPLAAALRALLGVLEPYAAQLDDAATVERATGELLRRGARGRVLIAGKHGGRPPGSTPAPRLGAFDAEDGWTWLDVVVADEPGALAALFATAARMGVNIEDLHVDHAPHRSTGVVSLAVRTADAPRLRSALDS